METIEKELARGTDASIIEIVNCVLDTAITRSVSDIHIDPTPHTLRIRMRIDGVLHDITNLPTRIHAEIIARIKVLSRLRTDEHQAAQDGRFRYATQTHHVDIRVSIVPTYHGENAVLRILSDYAADFTLENLGFSPGDRQKIQDACTGHGGMILATGPTGSGKTTTLYTLVKMLSTPQVSIITIEDPIEYAVEQIEQIQVNPRTGLSFANGLRSILRQDPDIIMVGEIRDAETARIAVNTALTGHLLLSTLHTNDASTTLPRLLDMGIEEYLVASTVRLAIAQRLVRKICAGCKQLHTENSMPQVSHHNITQSYRGRGCDACGGTGYAERISVNEVLVMNDRIKDAIMSKQSAAAIRTIAMESGMTTMSDDGWKKVAAGLTTTEEIFRVVQE